MRSPTPSVTPVVTPAARSRGTLATSETGAREPAAAATGVCSAIASPLEVWVWVQATRELAVIVCSLASAWAKPRREALDDLSSASRLESSRYSTLGRTLATKASDVAEPAKAGAIAPATSRAPVAATVARARVILMACPFLEKNCAPTQQRYNGTASARFQLSSSPASLANSRSGARLTAPALQHSVAPQRDFSVSAVSLACAHAPRRAGRIGRATPKPVLR